MWMNGVVNCVVDDSFSMRTTILMVLNHIIRHNHYLNEIETETETKKEGQKRTGDSKNKNTTKKNIFPQLTNNYSHICTQRAAGAI